jgi:hypothetical protein
MLCIDLIAVVFETSRLKFSAVLLDGKLLTGHAVGVRTLDSIHVDYYLVKNP